MKRHYTTALIMILTVIGATAQRWSPEMGANYVYTTPMGNMKSNIRQGHGVVLDFGMITPSKRFAIGAELQYTMYGYDKSTQEYDMNDGTTALMEVTVSNSFANVMAYGRYYFLTEGNFQPYLAVKGGYSHYSTDLNIYDPDDWDSCEPVDSDILQKDGTMVAALSAGFRLDFSSLFRRSTPGRLYIDFNTTISQGGNVKYMSTDAPTHQSHVHGATDSVEAEFINTQTQVVHSHHVGTLYSSPVQQLDFRLGVSFRINR
jgi:hypothetical protein